MQQFDLPLVAADISAESALMTAIDAGVSGVVLKTESGGLNLIHYDTLVSAAENNRSISPTDYIPILNIGNDTPQLVFDAVEAAGFRYGYLGETGDIAILLSVREPFAHRYTTVRGSRCTRPNKPPNRSDRDWYHYYPPRGRAPSDPNHCTVCGAPIP